MLTRLARWWLARKDRRQPAPPPPKHVHRGECICGAEVSGDDLHLVVSIPDDDQRLGIEGRTAMSADFCAEHCPGGCSLGCARISA